MNDVCQWCSTQSLFNCIIEISSTEIVKFYYQSFLLERHMIYDYYWHISYKYKHHQKPKQEIKCRMISGPMPSIGYFIPIWLIECPKISAISNRPAISNFTLIIYAVSCVLIVELLSSYKYTFRIDSLMSLMAPNINTQFYYE